MEPTTEIRRERVCVPSNLSVKELMEKYHISPSCAASAKKKGWITKNYRTKQIIIDRDNFPPGYSYTIAKKVFHKSFSRNQVAINIKEDLIPEAVTRMFEIVRHSLAIEFKRLARRWASLFYWARPVLADEDRESQNSAAKNCRTTLPESD